MSVLQNVKVTRDDARWEAEIRASIPAEALERYRKEALKDVASSVSISGFRPGKAPEDVVLKQVGETAILREAAEIAIKSELPELLASEKLNIVEAPQVAIETLEAGKPLAFVARAPLAPDVTLPDYKAIAKKHNENKEEVTVTDEEHAQTMTHLKRERARITKVELGMPPAEAHAEAHKTEEKDLPDLDDEFVKSLGYESLEKFSDAVRSNIKNEKELQAAEKRRATLLDQLIDKSKIKYPRILLEYEIDDMEGRLKGDLEQMRMTFEKYLEEVKKTEADLRKEWEPAADKRAKMRLVLAHIAMKENLDADPEKLAHEVAHAKKHYPNADEHNLRSHVHHALRNEAVIAFLEQQ